MRCQICGRKLKDPKSMELGYGPICYKNKYGVRGRIRKNGSESISNGKISYGMPGQMTLDDYLQTK